MYTFFSIFSLFFPGDRKNWRFKRKYASVFPIYIIRLIREKLCVYDFFYQNFFPGYNLRKKEILKITKINEKKLLSFCDILREIY